MCLLTDDIHDYYNVAQGKITIPNVDDGEECLLTDVSVLGDLSTWKLK
jgi:myosin heavy chain 6/7